MHLHQRERIQALPKLSTLSNLITAEGPPLSKTKINIYSSLPQKNLVFAAPTIVDFKFKSVHDQYVRSKINDASMTVLKYRFNEKDKNTETQVRNMSIYPKMTLKRQPHYKLSNSTPQENISIVSKIGLPYESRRLEHISLSTKLKLNHADNKKKFKMTKFSTKKLQTQWKYYIGEGNNSALVKQIMSRRPNWVQTQEYNTVFNFRWQQATDISVYSMVNYEQYRQLVNHYQDHQQISSKMGLVSSLVKFCKKYNEEPFSILPLSFILDPRKPQKLEEELKKFIFCYYDNEPMTPSRPRKEKEKLYREFIKALQGNKSFYSTNTIIQIQKKFDKKIPKLPSTFKSSQAYLWIIKPNSLNRGNGIKVISHLDQLIEFLQTATDGQPYILQKYIEKPLLLDSRKFDIRVWVLLDQQYNAYFFEEGYIRTSCEVFDLSTNSVFTHLTNNAIQKQSAKYGSHEEGNALSFSDFEKILKNDCLDQETGLNFDFKGKVLPQIKKVCGLTIESSRRKMINLNNKCCFEIFGFDFMLDSCFKLWLIEVNTNPCIETASTLLKMMVPRMLDDAFKVVIDSIFNGNKLGSGKSEYPLEGHSDSLNLWQKLTPAAWMEGSSP